MILVTYDLRKSGQNYSGLYGAIEGLGTWWHRLGSTWLLKTHLSTQQVGDHLRQHIDENDWLLVLEVKPGTANGWLPNEDWSWIQS